MCNIVYKCSKNIFRVSHQERKSPSITRSGYARIENAMYICTYTEKMFVPPYVAHEKNAAYIYVQPFGLLHMFIYI